MVVVGREGGLNLNFGNVTSELSSKFGDICHFSAEFCFILSTISQQSVGSLNAMV